MPGYRITHDSSALLGGGYDPTFTLYLHGPEGAIQFKFSRCTGRAAEIAREFASLYAWLEDGTPLMGWDLGYHSPVPTYEGQSLMEGGCEILPGGLCYYDGSGLQAEKLLKGWIRAGSDQWLIDQLVDSYEYHLKARPHDIEMPGKPVLALALSARAVTP